MEYALINTLVLGLSSAFILGFICLRIGMPAILGYLLAGILVGPYTPGFVADVSLAKQLAEVGIILLMFGVGLHFSFGDLLKVQKIAIPGALFQMASATLLGYIIYTLSGKSPLESFLYGFSLSVASTVVLLRALEHMSYIHTEAGKLAIGWLIVEDIAIVLALVLLPLIADLFSIGGDITVKVIAIEVLDSVFRILGFIFIMTVVGKRLLPKLLKAIDDTDSKELSTLGILSISLGFAYIAFAIFQTSFALGAFLAGMVLNTNAEGQKAAQSALPMRDAFAVLFFVATGMLFNPNVLIESYVLVILTLGVIVVGKSLAALIICYLFGMNKKNSFIIAISLAQIGEFSFILAATGLSKGIISYDTYNIILAGALVSIALNPFLFTYLEYHFKHKH